MNKKLLLIILAVFFVVLFVSATYFANSILPGIVKEKITTSLTNATQGNVTVDKVCFNIFKGVVITDLKLFEKDAPSTLLASVGEAHISFLILPLFKENEIILPSVKVSAVAINLKRDKNGSFNITSLFGDKKAPPQTIPNKKSKPFRLIIQSAQIKDATIIFNDENITPNARLALSFSRVKVKVSLKKIVFEALGQLAKDDQKTKIHLLGSYAFTPSVFLINLTADEFNLKTYEPYYQKLPVTLHTGLIKDLTLIGAVDDKNLKSEITFQTENLSLNKAGFNLSSCSLNSRWTIQFPKQALSQISCEGHAELQRGSFLLSSGFDGQAAIEKSSLNLIYNPQRWLLDGSVALAKVVVKKDALEAINGALEASFKLAQESGTPTKQNLTYEGSVNIKNADILGLKTIDSITSLTSTFKFKQRDLTFERISARLLDTFISATGTLKNNILTLDILGDVDLEKVTPLLKKQFSSSWPQMNGTSSLKIRLISDLAAKTPPLFSGEARFTKVNAMFPASKFEVSADKGTVFFDTKEESVQWDFLGAHYLDKNYKLEGILKGFKTPHVNADIVGEDLALKTEFTKNKDTTTIQILKGQYKNSTFNIHGDINPKENLKLSGQVTLNLKDGLPFLPKGQTTFEKMKPEGVFALDAEISGPCADFRGWNIKAKGKSGSLKLYGLTLTNIALDYAQLDQKGYLNDLSFDAYQGHGVIKGNIDFTDKKDTCLLNAKVDNLELNDLKSDTPMKDKTFYGTLSTIISVKGNPKDLNSLTGEGSLLIKKGNLWEFNPLKGLGSFLLIPRFTNIVFTNAQGDFTIDNGYVKTDNFELLGPEMGLIAEGKISFKGDLDFLVNTSVIPSGTRSSAEEETGTLKETTQLISKTGSLTGIKISGTVKEPKYKVQPIAENIAKKLSDIFSNFIP